MERVKAYETSLPSATLPAPGLPAQHALAPIHPMMAWPTGVIYPPRFQAHVPVGAVRIRGRSPALEPHKQAELDERVQQVRMTIAEAHEFLALKPELIALL